MASGINSTFRQVGIGVGVAGLGAIFQHEVAARTTAVLRREPDTQVLVKADNAVAYGRVVQAMVLLQQSGARKIGFITEPPPAARPRS
jgi:biopolymer transport protein TolR